MGRGPHVSAGWHRCWVVSPKIPGRQGRLGAHLGAAEELGHEAQRLQVALGQEQLALLQADLVLQLFLRLQFLQLFLATPHVALPVPLLPPPQFLLPLALALLLFQLLLLPAGVRGGGRSVGVGERPG